MCLGALVDAGASFPEMKRSLKKIPVTGYILSSRKVTRAGIAATKVDVVLKVPRTGSHKSDARRWKDIKKLIVTSSLDDHIKQKGFEIFKNLFEAEGRVHGEPFDAVHLHELGATDCIVDIFGTLIGLDLLGVKKVYVSPVNLGQGSVHSSHGVLPVPAPATIELLKGYPVYASEIPFELTTPTGAVILKTLATPCASLPQMTVTKTGYGAGNRDIASMPNALRIMIGDEDRRGKHVSEESVVILETNIDDMNPQYYENVVSRLFEAGALDVFLENIIMKKGRPAIKLTAIIREHDANAISELLFRETTTIGVRLYRAQRKVLEREIKDVKTRFGIVRFKISSLMGKVVTATPEYEDLKAIAEKKNIPVKEIAAELSRIPSSDFIC